MNNTDEYANKFPYYFVVDMATIQPANRSLQEIENKLKAELGNKNLVHSQAWPRLDDTISTTELWDNLRR